MTAHLSDPRVLTESLIRCPSVTPLEAGALDLLQSWLEPLGFECHRLTFTEAGHDPVENLYARLGQAKPNFCFAGHTDVVPIGDISGWTVDPFAADVRDDVLIGRGAVDMKGAIACYVAALARFLGECGGKLPGSLSLLITGDEEGEAVNGTRKVLDWLRKRGESLEACLVGEPTSEERLGDTVKIGRRGSLNGRLAVEGIQGHCAYPDKAENPIHHLIRQLRAITSEPLDAGNRHFQPSSLQVSSVDVGNPVSNVIPARAEARFNVRFNDRYDSAAVEAWLRERLDRAMEGITRARYSLDIRVSGESFLSQPGALSDAIREAVTEKLGFEPILGTGGGTSDARFIKDFCPVAELGLRNATAHKVDELVPLAELEALTQVYEAVLRRFFAP
jgi:succinyl-diaminopimelate desuccinylase